MEIERKFLVDRLPDDLTSYPSRTIEQGYLNIDPVIRIHSGGSFKKSQNICRYCVHKR